MLPDRYRESAENLHSAGPEGCRTPRRLGTYRPCRFAKAVVVFLAAKCSDVRGYDERDDRAGYPQCRFTWLAGQFIAGNTPIRGVDESLDQA